MSLFESASLVVTPNGTKASKLYAIKPTDGSGDLTVTRATTARRVNSAGLIESVANNVPRLDYTNSTCPSILVEPQRTNVLTYSEQFGTSWVDAGATIISNDTTAPDGNLTADRLTATGGVFGVVKFSTWTATNKVASCFVKANTSNLFRIANVSGGGGSVTFNLSTQAITATTGFTGSIEALPNGWFRCVAIDTLARSGTFSIGVTAISESVFVWGAQLEAGENATSYIPTTSASVTRNADVISKTGISSLIGQTEGTIYAEVKVSKLIGTAARYIFHISDGTVNNRIYMAFSGSSSNVLRGRIFSGGTLQCSIDSSTISATGTYKLALAYKNNDIVFYINGVQIGTDTSATIPTCSKVDLGHNYAGASQFNDSINNANVWKTRLSNSELATLTTL
jgi:hypothetical protein